MQSERFLEKFSMKQPLYNIVVKMTLLPRIVDFPFLLNRYSGLPHTGFATSTHSANYGNRLSEKSESFFVLISLLHHENSIDKHPEKCYKIIFGRCFMYMREDEYL